MRGAKSLSFGQQNITSRKVDALGTDVTAARRWLQYFDESSVRARMLLNQNDISTLRHLGAGENPHRFHWPKGTRKAMASRAFANELQFRRELCGVASAHGVAVHRRDGLWRLRALCRERLGERAPRRPFQIDFLAGTVLRNVRQNTSPGLVQRQ